MDKIEKFEKHPAYKEENLEIKTSKELEEAKKLAGVTTHEKAMERLQKEEKLEEAFQKKIDYRNLEDFQEFENIIEENVSFLDEKRCVDLFVTTNNLGYLNKAEEYLKDKFSREREQRIRFSEIESIIKKLIFSGKSELIPRFLKIDSRLEFDDYNKEKVIKQLLENGVPLKEAAGYLPKEIESIEKVIGDESKSELKAAYIKGLIKKGDFDKAKESILSQKVNNNYLDDVRKDLYLSAGKKPEDLEILTISNIYNLLREKKVDFKEVESVLKEKIGTIKGEHADYFKAQYYSDFSQLMIYEDIRKWLKETFEKISPEIKEKIIESDKQIIDKKSTILWLSEALISFKLDSETEKNVLNFLEKIDFTSPSLFLEKLSEKVSQENSEIVSFLLKKAQLLGIDSIAFELGEDYQKKRILDRLEDEIKKGRLKVKEERKKGRHQESHKIHEETSKKEPLFLKLVFEDYSKKKTNEEEAENAYKEFKARIEVIESRYYDVEQKIAEIINDFIKKENYSEALKILGDPEIKKSNFSRVSTGNFSKLVEYFVAQNDFDKAEELVEITGGRNELITQLITGLYKQGRKEEIDAILNKYLNQRQDPSEKEELLFNSYLELMRLTRP